MASVQTSFQLDDSTAKVIEELKKTFGVTSNTAVIRKAIALSRVAARSANNGAVTMIDADGDKFKVLLDG